MSTNPIVSLDTSNAGEVEYVSPEIVEGSEFISIDTKMGIVAVTTDPISVGDEIIVLETDSGDIALRGPIYSICVKVSDGFDRAVNYQYEKVSLGSVSFTWSGKGSVYLMSSCSASLSTDTIWADDQLKISTSKGSIIHNFDDPDGNVVTSTPPIDITSILALGNNEISFEVEDIRAVDIGCSSLYLVQIG